MHSQTLFLLNFFIIFFWIFFTVSDSAAIVNFADSSEMREKSFEFCCATSSVECCLVSICWFARLLSASASQKRSSSSRIRNASGQYATNGLFELGELIQSLLEGHNGSALLADRGRYRGNTTNEINLAWNEFEIVHAIDWKQARALDGFDFADVN